MNMVRSIVAGALSLLAGGALAAEENLLVSGGFAASGLPAGYTQVEYIQGDGTTSDIATDFVPHPQTDKVVLELEMTDTSKNMFAFCARKAAAQQAWSINLIGDASAAKVGFRLDYNNSSSSANSVLGCGIKTGVRYTYTLDRSVATCVDAQGVTIGSVSGAAVATFTEAGGYLHIFAAPGNANSIGNYKLYSFKIFRNDELIHDLVPALDNEGKAVLVDVVGDLKITRNGGFSAPGSSAVDDPVIEYELARDIMALVETVNPVVSGHRKFITLGYITDTHACKRVEGDADPVNPVTKYWYHDDNGNPKLVNPESSIRLLGKVAASVAFDGLIHAGDFSTAITEEPFGEGDYLNQIRAVRAMVSKHLPDTPFFAVDGNHDRDYWNADRSRGHSMSDAEWAAVLAEINTDVTGSSAIVRTSGTGNSYALDFRRCLADGGKNVRLVMTSLFDANGGNDPAARMSEGLVFADPSLAPSNTIVGVTAHDYRDGFAASVSLYLRSNPGAGFFGAITGHRHAAATERIAGVKADNIVVRNACANFGDTTASAYRLSVFVFDTDNQLLREIRLAGGNNNTPTLYDHPIAVSDVQGMPEHPLLAIAGEGSSYFTTDFVPNPQTDKLVITLELPRLLASQFAFAARKSNLDASAAYSLNLRTEGFRFDYKTSTGRPILGPLETFVKYTFTAENNVMTWDGGEDKTAAKDEKFDQAGGPLRIFSAAGNDTISSFWLYAFQIYRNGTLIHDLQPYYKSAEGPTLIDRVEGAEPIALTLQGDGSFVAIEDPRRRRGTRQLDWIQGDGATCYFETDFVPDPSRDKMEATVTLTDVSGKQFLFSARKAWNVDAWSLQMDAASKIRYDYNTDGTPQNRSLETGVRYVFTADRNELTWSHGAGIVSSKALFDTAGGRLYILAARDEGGVPSNVSSARLHSFRVWRDGKLIHEFLPTRLPSGAVTLLDWAPEPALVLHRGSFRAGPVLPPSKGLILMVF